MNIGQVINKSVECPAFCLTHWILIFLKSLCISKNVVLKTLYSICYESDVDLSMSDGEIYKKIHIHLVRFAI